VLRRGDEQRLVDLIALSDVGDAVVMKLGIRRVQNTQMLLAKLLAGLPRGTNGTAGH
jgi:hypothetical protein